MPPSILLDRTGAFLGGVSKLYSDINVIHAGNGGKGGGVV